VPHGKLPTKSFFPSLQFDEQNDADEDVDADDDEDADEELSALALADVVGLELELTLGDPLAK
jgi:hypothetical protein